MELVSVFNIDVNKIATHYSTTWKTDGEIFLPPTCHLVDAVFNHSDLHKICKRLCKQRDSRTSCVRTTRHCTFNGKEHTCAATD